MNASDAGSWHRWHSHGWVGIVRQQPDGSFGAATLPPSGGALASYRSFEEARAGADRDAARSGHACDEDCESWQEGGPGV